MSDTQETIAGIIAEMRALSNPISDGIIAINGKSIADRLEAALRRESDEMLDALVRIGNWCAQDLAENAYTSDSSGNYLKTLNGLCEVCRPFMQKARKLKRYGGAE
jgi:hypothetical protein